MVPYSRLGFEGALWRVELHLTVMHLLRIGLQANEFCAYERGTFLFFLRST